MQHKPTVFEHIGLLQFIAGCLILHDVDDTKGVGSSWPGGRGRGWGWRHQILQVSLDKTAHPKST
jgi:hypothetical protein